MLSRVCAEGVLTTWTNQSTETIAKEGMKEGMKERWSNTRRAQSHTAALQTMWRAVLLEGECSHPRAPPAARLREHARATGLGSEG
jgi:hypothetical protein